MLKNYLTVAEAAELLEIRPETVVTGISENRIAATKVGRQWMIDIAEIEAYRARTRPNGIKAVGRPRKAVNS